LVKEFFSLGDNFVYYRRGLVKVPNQKQKAIDIARFEQCTFKPKINSISA